MTEAKTKKGLALVKNSYHERIETKTALDKETDREGYPSYQFIHAFLASKEKEEKKIKKQSPSSGLELLCHLYFRDDSDSSNDTWDDMKEIKGWKKLILCELVESSFPNVSASKPPSL